MAHAAAMRLAPGRYRERSRTRWRGAAPDANLTWGFEPEGRPFIERAAAHGVFGSGRTVAEIGPGYGRLPAAALELGVEFERWIGVDLSPANVSHLRERFDDPRLSFVEGDAETVRFEQRPDALVSSLTFKHLFPTFEKALTHLATQLNEGAIVAIDVIEGERGFFEDDGVTWIRWYTRPEVEQIFGRAGFELRAFDEVVHHPELVRLLAVGVKR